MPIFMIERNYAEQLDPTEARAAEINVINEDEGVHWLYSFLSADLRKTYWLYDAPSAEAVVVELNARVQADGTLAAV